MSSEFLAKVMIFKQLEGRGSVKLSKIWERSKSQVAVYPLPDFVCQRRAACTPSQSSIMLVWVPLLGLSALTHAQNLAQTRQPFELVIHRDLPSAACTLVSLRETQIHKRLAREELVLEQVEYNARGEIADEGEGAWQRLQYFSLNSELLAFSARDLCGDEVTMDYALPFNAQRFTWSPPGTTQKVLTPAHWGYAEPPPLEIHPLIQSGSSSNRVDFTFFSDGCAPLHYFLDSLFIYSQLLPLQIRRMNGTSSLRMQCVSPRM
jgi:hypothetical protein